MILKRNSTPNWFLVFTYKSKLPTLLLTPFGSSSVTNLNIKTAINNANLMRTVEKHLVKNNLAKQKSKHNIGRLSRKKS